MTTTTTAAYQYRTRVQLSYDEAVARVTDELKKEGFGVLTEIDMKATLKKKLDVDFRRYVILGACNPPMAYKAIESELEIGLLLPCNVIVYEDGDESVVSAVDPALMLGVVNNPAVEPIATEVASRLQRVIAAVGS